MPSRIFTAAIASMFLGGAAASEDPLARSTRVAGSLQQFCGDCHAEGSGIEGGVDLSIGALDALDSDARTIRKLMDVLDTRQMPPEDGPEVPSRVRERLLEDLQAMLHAAVAKSRPSVRTPIRRMNRFQYNNAVVDLFELNCIVFTLPEKTMREHKGYFDPASGKMPDKVTVGNRPLGKSQMIEPRLAGVAAFPQDLRAEHGYDNRGDHLSMSPLLMESFLSLGQSIVQSPDFTAERVGIWRDFFAPPTGDANLVAELELRLRRFLGRAFRRDVNEKVVDRYASFVLGKLDAGEDFTSGMLAVASATIASPRFLYLYDEVEHGEEGVGQRLVTDYELASRLSFFLWGSIPDETLLSLASEGRLSQPDVLDQQIDRMLKHRKLKRFCDSFPLQWLQLDRIVSATPSRDKFPGFYFAKYRMSMHMMLEPLLLFETVLIEDQPITQLIDPDFTYRSAKLEGAYGELGGEPGESTGGGVTMLTFHRVPVTDRRVGGVITNAAVMTMTSGPERTKPITRGAWVAGVVFNDPPEPPPADVPPLPSDEGGVGAELSLRERLAAHRERADCRGCHEQIDPLGFALENFNPVGGWRDQYDNGREINSSGRLFRQHEFAGAAEFKSAVLAEKDRFCRALAGHLLGFALAREIGPEDSIALDRITRATAADGYRMQTLIRQLIHSKPFKTKS